MKTLIVKIGKKIDKILLNTFINDKREIINDVIAYLVIDKKINDYLMYSKGFSEVNEKGTKF